MQVPTLGWEDPLEKEMATHSNILAWEIPWTEEPGGLQSNGVKKNWTQRLNNHNQTMGEHHQESVLRVFTLSGPHRAQHRGSGWSWVQVSLGIT